MTGIAQRPISQKEMNITIAIDPGLSGGVAYQLELQPAQAVAMPATEGDLVDLLRSLTADANEAVAYVEEVGGYIGKAARRRSLILRA